jgi:hypothetical protein
MPLRGKVGRHANTSRQCQNWKEDQQTVIALLNRIPIADGGAEGMLKPPVIAGYAADGLFTSILYFQKKHFPGVPSGFVEPGSPALAKLESLASRPPPPPPKPGQWDGIKSGSVNQALRQALTDLTIEHSEVVEMIRATLSDGNVSAEELDDLLYISGASRSVSPRSKALLEDFYGRVQLTTGGKGPYKLPSDKHQFAADMVCNFLKRSGTTYFPKLHRDKVGIGLLMRIANPSILRQGRASLCGPAAMLHSLASDRPGEYARFAMDLFEEGKAKVGRLFVKPGPGVRNFLPEPRAISQVDWLTMASLRDSENWFLDYDDTEKEVGGITTPGELHEWFRLAGYSDIKNDTNLTNMTYKDSGTVDDANELFAKGYRVCLFISANMMEEKDQSWRGSIFTRHWVVQRSKIDLAKGKEIVRVFSWGQGDYKVPEGSKELSADEFLGNFYGYVAAKA